MTYYLQHGKAGEPMRTEKVEIKERLLSWKRICNTNYTGHIPTITMVKYIGHWHRVYSTNSGTLYILKDNQQIVVTKGY